MEYWLSPGLDTLLKGDIDRYVIASNNSPHTLAVGYNVVKLSRLVYSMNENSGSTGWHTAVPATLSVTLKIWPLCGSDANGIPVPGNSHTVTTTAGTSCGVIDIAPAALTVGNTLAGPRLNLAVSMKVSALPDRTIPRSIGITIYGTLISPYTPT
jgi:hypothetical protein